MATDAQRRESGFEDSDRVIADLTDKHRLHGLMPAARAWVADQFYASEAPTLPYLRLKRGLTQAGLAAQLGIPQSSVSRLENGQENPSIERAKKMADALGVTLDTYFTAYQQTKRTRGS